MFRQAIEPLPGRLLRAVGLRFGTNQRANKGILTVRLYEDERELAAWSLPATRLEDNALRDFALDRPHVMRRNRVYAVTVSESFRGRNGVAIWTDDTAEGVYEWNGEPRQAGVACYRLTYSEPGYAAAIAIALAALLLLALAVSWVKWRDGLRRRLTPAALYCLIALMGMAAVLASFAFARQDPWSRFFWFNTGESPYYHYADTGMDFLNSIEYLKGNDPYAQWETIYPPLANLFFRGLYQLVPEVQKSQWTDDFWSSILLRRGENDLRVWMPTMMLLMVFLVVATLLCYMIVVNYDRRRCRGLLAFTLVFSYGHLYAMERGNIIILSMATALFFVLYYDSPRRWVRELALLSLAVSANLKLYPAVFGVLLLYDRRWREALRAVIYGVALFLLPCLTFEHGLANLGLLVRYLFGFATRAVDGNLGTSLDKLCYSVLCLLRDILNWPVSEELCFAVGRWFNIVALPLCLLCGLGLGKKWQRVLCCALGFMLFSNQGVYGTIFIALPAVLFFEEERRFAPGNIAPFVGIALCLTILPVFSEPGSDFSLGAFRLQIGLAMLLGCVVVPAVRRRGKPSAG